MSIRIQRAYTHNSNKAVGVIVIGGHVQGLGIVRIYGRNQIPCIVLDETPFNLARHSKYCNDCIIFEPNMLITKLYEIGKKDFFQNWLLVPTSDKHVKDISQNRESLAPYFTITSDIWERVEIFYNKKLTYNLAYNIGVRIPETFFPVSISDLSNSEIRFPCILKPTVMHEFYSIFKKKVIYCQDKEFLIEKYKWITSIVKQQIIIQEIIPGESKNLYSVCFLFNGKEPLVTLCARRARQHPIDFGNATTYAETVDIPEIIETSIKLLREVGYKGICEVEYKYDSRDDNYKLLEVNPRTWKWHVISEKSNSPFLVSLYRFFQNIEVDSVNTWDKASYIHCVTDFPVRLKMLLKGLKVRTSRKKLQLAVWDWKDLMPVIYEFIYLPYNLLKR